MVNLPSPPSGVSSRGSPGKSEGGKQRCSRNRLTGCGGCQSAIRRALLSDALPSVDVAGVEPALGPLNGHILVGGRTPFAEFEVQRFRGRTNPDRLN